jgi:hypothetical protein
MTRILWHVTMSLDGFIAPPDDSTDWMFGFGRVGVAGRTAMERTTAILTGRRGYDLGNRPDGSERRTYGGAWSGPIVVLTHRPPESPDSGFTFVTTLEDGVDVAREAAGDGATERPGATRSGVRAAPGRRQLQRRFPARRYTVRRDRIRRAGRRHAARADAERARRTPEDRS